MRGHNIVADGWVGASNPQPNNSCHALTHLSIADCFRSLEIGFIAFRLGNKKFLTEKEKFDFKENRKLKHSHFELC